MFKRQRPVLGEFKRFHRELACLDLPLAFSPALWLEASPA